MNASNTLFTLYTVSFALALARSAAFVMALPGIGSRATPAIVKAAWALSLAVLVVSVHGDRLPQSTVVTLAARDWSAWVALGLAMGREIVIGAFLGLVFELVLTPARIAGEYLNQETGLTFGELVSPSGAPGTGPFSGIFEALAMLVLFGLDLHHLFFRVWDGAFAWMPMGDYDLALPGVDRLAGKLQHAQSSGILMVAPVGLVLFLSTILLVLLTRVAPALNLYTVGFPLRLVLGIVGLVVFLVNVSSNLVKSIWTDCHALPSLFGGG